MKKTVCFIFLSGLLTVSSVLAATRTWLNSEGGLWTNNVNWSDSTLPVANDIADLSAATNTIIALTADVTVGEILYNPAFSGTTNTLTILSDTAAPSSRTITLTTTATCHVQVGEGAELLMDADIKPTVNTLKDGQGSLVIKRRLLSTATARIELYVEQGRLINEGTITFPVMRFFLGTVEPDTNAAPEFVMREGSSYYSSNAASNPGSDLLLGGNRLLGSGTGSRAVITHEGGILDLTTNITGGVFLNGYAASGSSVYNLSGGEVNLSTKTAYVGFWGMGTVNQTGGKLKVGDNLACSYSTTGRGYYNFTGGELWLGGFATGGSGQGYLNIGAGCIYPLGKGFAIYDNTHPKLTGINGLTRFCSTGSGFTNSISGVSGSGGFVKEGADTLNISGSPHSFSGPVIISNGTVNVSTSMTGGNAALVAGGSLNFNEGVSVIFTSLMVTGGVFQVSSNCVFVLKSSDPWARVTGTGTARLLDGSKLLRLDVSESGAIDLSAGGTASVYRVRIDGVELAPGIYSSANCAAIAGSGLLAVSLQNERCSIADTFSRADGPVANDSLGRTEELGGTDWSEYPVYAGIGNVASITTGELRLGNGNSDPAIVLTAASWPNGMASTRMRFGLVGNSGATVKNGCGLMLRRNITIRTGLFSASPDWSGAVHVLMTPTGGLFLRENYRDTKYSKNPFTGGDFLTYGAAGSLPVTINGLPFDADGDGRLGDDEPFELQAILYGSRLQVLINGEPVAANNGFSAPDSSAENCAGFWKNRLSSGNVETHDSYHDDFSITNLSFLIRHIDSFDPNIAAALPRENWILSGDTNLVPVGPVNETVGGETVQAWNIDDSSTDTLANYRTYLTTSECTEVNTNRWRLTMRLRVVNANDPVDEGVFGEVSTVDKRFYLRLGSDISGNAQIKLDNSTTIHTITGGSVYHTYVMEYDPETECVSLSCDGTLLQAGSAGVGAGYKRVLWGANGSAAKGSANYQLVQFEFLPPPSPVSPATLILLR
jgi:autotransporter-associated beta strand protein